MKAKKNQYYLKDKKAQIYRKTSERDPGGYSSIEKYYPIAPSPIWCYSSQLSQTDIFIAASYSQTETRFFVFNHYSGIEVYDMIKYKNAWYRVTRVDTADDYNGDVFVYVENAKGGWIPKDDEIQPYTPGIWQE